MNETVIDQSRIEPRVEQKNRVVITFSAAFVNVMINYYI